jgi:hypothetical protein
LYELPDWLRFHSSPQQRMQARFVPCPPRTAAGAWTWRRQDLECAIINDATPKKIAAAKVTVSKGSQVCTYSI